MLLNATEKVKISVEVDSIDVSVSVLMHSQTVIGTFKYFNGRFSAFKVFTTRQTSKEFHYFVSKLH